MTRISEKNRMGSFTVRERLAVGKALREGTPRAAHGVWTAAENRPDAIELLELSNQGRLPELIPIRYGRMLRSPFTFLRGAAALMAHDLAGTPWAGNVVQACGDCHLLNFGLFATPERNLVFDLNDFDETLHAPWEWDLKRLATSFVVAAEANGFSDRRARDAALACVRSYREHLREFAAMSPLEIWYTSVRAEDLIAQAADGKARQRREQMAAKARRRVGDSLFPKIVEEVDGQHHFVEQPPLTTRVNDESREAWVREGLEKYRASLADDLRYAFDRYRLEDFAMRVVGIGSVGTRCFVGLFFCDDQSSLFLQFKEARRSVLESSIFKAEYENQGQRVVVGQRLMQAASDMFLGWLRMDSGHDYFVRQLRDMKYSVPVETLSALQLQRYAEVCGWTLARSHAKSGDAATISGYLGRGEKFDNALADFAAAYARQNQRDYDALVAAVRSGRIEAIEEEA